MTICASCCSTLQRVAMCHSALLSRDPRIRKPAKTLYNSIAGCCSELRCAAVCYSVSQRTILRSKKEENTQCAEPAALVCTTDLGSLVH